MNIRTAEAVSPAHPDKMADQISDMVLDAALAVDPQSRVAIETLGGHGQVYVVGEMTTHADIDVGDIVRQVLRENRYEDYNGYGVTTNIVRQSPDIARGVDVGGAGDQGIMVGYACKDNELAIPQELYLAKQILRELWKNPNCRDAKSQVTLRGKDIQSIVVSAERMKYAEIDVAVRAVLDANKYPAAEAVLYNPAGPWANGGFEADTGLTGRKIACDNYGPQVEIGGGCFSGKDPTKVDRSAAYMARKVALEELKATGRHSMADWVRVKVAYAIGISKPVMVSVQQGDYGTHDITQPEDSTERYAERFKPASIIKELDLLGTPYYEVAKWGSFGGQLFQWELPRKS